MNTSGAAQPLPVPEHFTFEWDTPEEAAREWAVDLMHWPHGVSPLTATMDLPAFFRGLSDAARRLCLPFTNMDVKVLHGYVYASALPYSFDIAKMEERMGAMQQRMMEHVPGLYARWQSEYEPEISSSNVEMRTTDYGSFGDRELSDWLEGMVAKRERAGLLHFLAVFPASGAVRVFEELYRAVIGEPRAGEHYQLLQGFPNKSIETGYGLWRLAAEARRRPEVLKILQTAPLDSVERALGEGEGGRAFRGAVSEFLDVFGWRSNEFDIGSPTWKEQPATVYALIREYAAREGYDLEAEQRAIAAARLARERIVLDKAAQGGPAGAMFEQVLRAAQQYLPVQEDHNFWIDQQGSCVQRVPLLEAGRRLAASGRLADAEDVFLLHYDELQESLRSGSGDLRELAERRRDERGADKALTPPARIGTKSPIPQPEDKFFGEPPEASKDPRIINGRGASAGKVTGMARVLMTLDEAERLRKGEILVCPATMPPWTPLFALASAVVTNHGGVLSHTAIVAREYGIPAVLATQFATDLIRDGQTITVDGTAGTVTLED